MNHFKELKPITFLFVELFFYYLSSLNKSGEYQSKNKGGGGDGFNSYAITLKPNLFKVPFFRANTKNNPCEVLIQV